MTGPITPRYILVATLTTALFLAAPAAADDARLPEPAFGLVHALRSEGRPQEALARLEDELGGQDAASLPPEALVLEAVLLAECGRAEESEKTWRIVAEREPVLRAFASRRTLVSLAARGEPEAASELLQALIKREGIGRCLDLTVLVADAFMVKRDFDGAAALCRRVLSASKRSAAADKARLSLAAALEAKGDTKGAAAALRGAQLYFLSPGTFRVAHEAEHRLAAVGGEESEPLSESQYYGIAERLREASRYEGSLALLAEWRNAYPGSEKLETIDFEVIDTLFQMRNNADAKALCRQFLSDHPGSRLLPSIKFMELRLAIREGDTETVASLASDFREGRIAGASSSQRYHAGLMLASYLIGIGQVEGGLGVYRQLYRSSSSQARKTDILWRVGVAAYRAGQMERAAANLRALADRNPRGEMQQASLYWLGLAEAALGRFEAAAAPLLELQERYTYDYYGFRARVALGDIEKHVPEKKLAALRRSAALKPLQFPELRLNQTTQRHAAYRCAEILARAGLLAEAAAELDALLRTRRGDSTLALVAARAHAAAGNHRRAAAVLESYFAAYLRRPAEGLPADFWELAFPRPYWRHIKEAAETNGVDPTMMLALMRQESRYDPEAVSPAGAVGLFQIMTYTAARIGPRMGIGVPDGTALRNPSVNAAISARLLAGLMELFNSRMLPAIASYNAGEDRVASWWGSAANLADDVFIDSIPYRETRDFMRRVLANYFTYLRVYPPSEFQ